MFYSRQETDAESLVVMPGSLETRVETADYVVRAPRVSVFSKPHSGIVVSEREKGTILSTSMITSGSTLNDVWVRVNEYISTSETGEGWVMVDSTLLGLGVQLEKQAFERLRLLKWYVAEAQVEVRDSWRGGVVVGHRAAGRVLRTDHELSGWCRLTEDFRRDRDGGEADVVEGWFSLAANMVRRWHPPGMPASSPPESLPGKPFWYWVATRRGITVRDRPWGALITKREHGELLRGDVVEDG